MSKPKDASWETIELTEGEVEHAIALASAVKAEDNPWAAAYFALKVLPLVRETRRLARDNWIANRVDPDAGAYVTVEYIYDDKKRAALETLRVYALVGEAQAATEGEGS